MMTQEIINQLRLTKAICVVHNSSEVYKPLAIYADWPHESFPVEERYKEEIEELGYPVFLTNRNRVFFSLYMDTDKDSFAVFGLLNGPESYVELTNNKTGESAYYMVLSIESRMHDYESLMVDMETESKPTDIDFHLVNLNALND